MKNRISRAIDWVLETGALIWLAVAFCVAAWTLLPFDIRSSFVMCIGAYYCILALGILAFVGNALN